MSKDILKDAIAQAKVLKEVAVENAKTILLESFEPKINGILSKKLTNEIDGEEDENFREDGLEEAENSDENKEFSDTPNDEQDVTSDLEETEDSDKTDIYNKFSEKNQDDTSMLNEDDDEFNSDKEEDLNKPTLSTENEDIDEDDLEFESILKELDDEVENKVPTKEMSTNHSDNDEEFPENDETVEDEKELNLETESEEDDEDIDIEELLSEEDDELSDEEELETPKDKKQLSQLESLKRQNIKLKKQLSESNAVIKTLNKQINDINILNHKLVHTIKLFRNFNLSNESKMRIVETFDRAKSVREIKLIYTTLYESLKNTDIKRTKKSITSIAEVKNNGASKTIIGSEQFAKSTIMSEGADLKERFKKLANIKD